MLKDEQVAEHLAPHKRESLKKEAFASFSEAYQQLGIYIADISIIEKKLNFVKNSPPLALLISYGKQRRGSA